MDKNLYNLLEELRKQGSKVEQAEAQVKASKDFLKDCKKDEKDSKEELMEYFNRTKVKAVEAGLTEES